MCGSSWLKHYLRKWTCLNLEVDRHLNRWNWLQYLFKIKINTDIVDNELPLLLKRKKMKRLIDAKIDFENDAIHISGHINISFTSSGYYYITHSWLNQAIFFSHWRKKISRKYNSSTNKRITCHGRKQKWIIDKSLIWNIRIKKNIHRMWSL